MVIRWSALSALALEVQPLGEYTIHHDIHVIDQSYGYFAQPMYIKRKILAIFVKIAFFFLGTTREFQFDIPLMCSWTGTDHKILIKLSHPGRLYSKTHGWFL